MHSVNLFELASQQANWATVRQRVIANNIANANTNGFTPSDVAPFKEVLSRTSGGMSVTSTGHFGDPADKVAFNVTEKEVSADFVGESGSKVKIEDELIAAGEVRRSYELNTAIVKSFHRMILMTTRGG